MFCQKSLLQSDNDSQFLTIGSEVGKSFVTTTTTLSTARGSRAKRAGFEELKLVGDEKLKISESDLEDDSPSKILLIDMSQKLLEKSSASVAIMVKKFDTTTNSFMRIGGDGEGSIPGFSVRGAPLIVCKSFVIEGPQEDLKQKGIVVL